MAFIVSCSIESMPCDIFFKNLLKSVGEAYYETFFGSFQVFKIIENKAVFSVSSSWCRAYLEMYFSQIIRDNLGFFGKGLSDFEIILRNSEVPENRFVGSRVQKPFTSKNPEHKSLSVSSFCQPSLDGS